MTTRADTFVPLGIISPKLTALLSIQNQRVIEFGVPPDKVSPPTLLSTFLQERSPPDKGHCYAPSSGKVVYSRLCGSTYYNVYSHSYDDLSAIS